MQILNPLDLGLPKKKLIFASIAQQLMPEYIIFGKLLTKNEPMYLC